MNFKFWKNKSEPNFVKFKDTTGLAYGHNPIVPANQVPAHFAKFQKNRKEEVNNFEICPGLPDYKNTGWIIPAWEEIFIKANRVTSSGFVGNAGSEYSSGFKNCIKMDKNIIQGVFKPMNDVDYTPLHFGAPWSVYVTRDDVSLLVMPAFYHSNFLDDLYVYPGIVDYSNKFCAINFICSARRECEVRIKAGEPLLQVIPLIKNTYTATIGKATQKEMDMFSKRYSMTNQFYRKYVQIKSKYKIENE